MQIQKDILLEILDLSKLAVATKEQVEQLSHFIFTGDEIVTFNNRMAIFYEFKTNFVCSVRADLFYKQLSKFHSNEISVSLKNSKLTMQALNEKASLSVTLDKDDEVFKILHMIQNNHVDCERFVVPEDFERALSFTSFSASRDAADGVLGCICVDDNYVYSTDNWRATQYEMEEPVSNKLLIDHLVASQLNKFEVFEYSVSHSWISFYCDNDVTISARRIQGDYPDYHNAFELDECEELEFPETLTDAVDFVSVILSKENELDRVADISIEGHKIIVSCDRVTESSEKTISFDNIQTDIHLNFSINLEFLKKILVHTHKMKYDTETGRAMFNSDKFKHIIRMR